MPTCSSFDECDVLLRRNSPACSRLSLRPLLPADLPDVQALCASAFPIQYPECWFQEVVSGSLTSLGLFEGTKLAAIMVSETKRVLHCNTEDRDILSDAGSYVVYILSLAVSHEFRRMGLASRLLQHLLDTVVENPPYPRAVFLHVLSTNSGAINFYRRNGFTHHDTLLNYYRLEGKFGDGCTYVRYTNGSHPPLSLSLVCRLVGSAICFPMKRVYKIFAYS